MIRSAGAGCIPLNPVSMLFCPLSAAAGYEELPFPPAAAAFHSMAKKKTRNTGEDNKTTAETKEEKSSKKTKDDEKDSMTLKEALSSLTGRKRVALAVFVAVVTVSLVLLFLFTLIDVVTPENMTEEEFHSLLSKLDGREWTVKKGDEDKIASVLYSFEPTTATTEKDGNTLLIVLSDDSMDYTVRFAYVGGSVQGLIGATRFTLYHSSGKKETNRVLSLVSKEEKITLYEE